MWDTITLFPSSCRDECRFKLTWLHVLLLEQPVLYHSTILVTFSNRITLKLTLLGSLITPIRQILKYKYTIHFIRRILLAVTLCPVGKLTSVMPINYRIFWEDYCPYLFVCLFVCRHLFLWNVGQLSYAVLLTKEICSPWMAFVGSR